MNPIPKKSVRDRMIEEIKAEVDQQPVPNGVTDATLDQLIKAVVDAQLGLKSGQFPTERKAAESIVTKLQQIIQ